MVEHPLTDGAPTPNGAPSLFPEPDPQTPQHPSPATTPQSGAALTTTQGPNAQRGPVALSRARPPDPPARPPPHKVVQRSPPPRPPTPNGGPVALSRTGGATPGITSGGDGRKAKRASSSGRAGWGESSKCGRAG